MVKIELMKHEDLEDHLFYHLVRRRMPDYFLYIANNGAENWLELDRSREFAVASELTRMLQEHLEGIARHLGAEHGLLSIGTGSGDKERIILQALVDRGFSPAFYCVDVSSGLVDTALATVGELPAETVGLVGLFEDLPRFEQYWRHPFLLTVLGNSFCNYEPDFFFRTLHNQLQDRDLLLFDCHLLVSSSDIEAARREMEQLYRTRQNREFNLAPLVSRGLDANKCRFRLDLLPTHTSMGTVYRTRKQVNLLEDATITCGFSTVDLLAGDTIELGFNYKYTLEQLERLMDKHGFSTVERRLSEDRSNLLMLARKR